MDAKVVSFYREIFADLTVDREEAAELTDFLESLNAPPDKLDWLRFTAFRIGCEFLSEEGDNDANVALLRTINCIVHAIEKTCLEPKWLVDPVPMDEDKLTAFYKSLYDDLSVDRDEAEDLYEFFRDEYHPDRAALVPTRAWAFKVGCEYLVAVDKDQNVKLLRCVNSVVRAFEHSCLQPQPFELKVSESTLQNLDGLSLEGAVQHLWNIDVNRLTPDEDYVINVQKGKKPYWKEDNAPDPLFTSIDRTALKRPTYAAFVALLDNYVAETGQAEKVSNVERKEIKTFLKAIMETGPMQFCHKYCRAKDPSNVPASRDAFLKLLHEVWFALYRRGGQLDSSGFEHVFIGEIKNDEVSGFHNWIQLAKEEKRGHLDYRGYIKPRGSGEAAADGDDHLLTIQFRWNGVEKFVGTSFIGSSPEFEMALYTMCFLVGEEENVVQLNTGTDEFGLKIKCYSMARDKIGTAFPEVTSHYED